jgi:hypothetical protein
MKVKTDQIPKIYVPTKRYQKKKKIIRRMNVKEIQRKEFREIRYFDVARQTKAEQIKMAQKSLKIPPKTK